MPNEDFELEMIRRSSAYIGISAYVGLGAH